MIVDDTPRRVAILGSIPPPFGGITVHINRLTQRLADVGVPYRLYDRNGRCIPSRNIVPCGKGTLGTLKFLFTVREPIIHIHPSRVSLLLAALTILPLRNRRVLLSLHSESMLRWYKKTNVLFRFLLRHCLQKASHIICPNKTIYDWLQQIGTHAKNLSTVPAFIRPSQHERDENHLTHEVRLFLKDHSPVVGSHGWFGYFIKGVHVYSFDMIIKLIQQVREQHHKAGFYTLISGTYDENHRKTIFNERKRLGLEKDWLIVEDIESSVALYARSNVFVRPTITDGDSVSIRECLIMGTPVVASDAVQRPQGCVLFKSRDLASLTQAVNHVLGHGVKALEHSPAHVEDMDGSVVISLYQALLADTSQ